MWVPGRKKVVVWLLYCLVAFSFLEFLRGGPKGGGKSNVLGMPLFLLLFLVFLLFQKVSKGTPNLREKEGKGKATVAKLLLFHVDSRTLVEVSSQHKAVVNYHS